MNVGIMMNFFEIFYFNVIVNNLNIFVNVGLVFDDNMVSWIVWFVDDYIFVDYNVFVEYQFFVID